MNRRIRKKKDKKITEAMDNANLMDGWRILEEPTASNG